MELNDYQVQARNYANYPLEIGPFSVIYGIVSDVGVLSNKLRTILEDKHGEFDDNDKVKIQISLGDIMIGIAHMASDLNLTLDEVASINLRKQAMIKEKAIEAEKSKES